MYPATGIPTRWKFGRKTTQMRQEVTSTCRISIYNPGRSHCAAGRERLGAIEALKPYFGGYRRLRFIVSSRSISVMQVRTIRPPH